MKLLTVQNNLPELLRFWKMERRAPRWFKDMSRTKSFKTRDFVKWCQKKWRIYEILDGQSALFVERNATRAEIHFGLLRGTDTANLTKELFDIRTDIFCAGIEMIFGWVAKKNVGLKRICEQLGLVFHGLQKFEGESHNQVTAWQCYAVAQREILRVPSFAEVN